MFQGSLERGSLHREQRAPRTCHLIDEMGGKKQITEHQQQFGAVRKQVWNGVPVIPLYGQGRVLGRLSNIG